MIALKQKIKGFTLAETLIAMVVIGIIAAVTIPIFVVNYQKNITVTRLKKAYSEINQALRISQSKFGMVTTWDFSDFGNIKTLKVCSPGTTECWSDTYNLNNKKYMGATTNTHNSFITVSGYSVHYRLHDDGTGAWFYIDINSSKKPNILGKDVFIFVFNWDSEGSKPELYPCGLNRTTKMSRDDLITGAKQASTSTSVKFNCKKDGSFTGAGGYCAALIMLDNWQIKKDYPYFN